MDTARKFHIEQSALRIYIFASGVLLTAYCGLLCFGIRHFIAELLCVVGAYLLLCGGAWMFRLCCLSWAFIIYSFAIRLCIMLYTEGFFDGAVYGYPLIDIAHYTAFSTGLVLCFLLFRRFI